MSDFYSGEKTLVWEPAAEPRIIPHCYAERAMKALDETFGPFPITLGKDELRILRAMDLAGAHRPIGELASLVEQHGTIRVWAVPGWRPSKDEIAAMLCSTS